MKKHMQQYAPEDPHYETVTDERTGKTKKVKVSLPPVSVPVVGGRA
jgi:hypothetical protein